MPTATARLATLLATDQPNLAAAVTAEVTVSAELRVPAPISVVACPYSAVIQISHALDSPSHPTRYCTPSAPGAWPLKISLGHYAAIIKEPGT